MVMKGTEVSKKNDNLKIRQGINEVVDKSYSVKEKCVLCCEEGKGCLPFRLLVRRRKYNGKEHFEIEPFKRCN